VDNHLFTLERGIAQEGQGAGAGSRSATRASQRQVERDDPGDLPSHARPSPNWNARRSTLRSGSTASSGPPEPARPGARPAPTAPGDLQQFGRAAARYGAGRKIPLPRARPCLAAAPAPRHQRDSRISKAAGTIRRDSESTGNHITILDDHATAAHQITHSLSDLLRARARKTLQDPNGLDQHDYADEARRILRQFLLDDKRSRHACPVFS